MPNIELYENNPANKVNIKDLFKAKKGIIFGVPGNLIVVISLIYFKKILEVVFIKVHLHQDVAKYVLYFTYDYQIIVLNQ